MAEIPAQGRPSIPGTDAGRALCQTCLLYAPHCRRAVLSMLKWLTPSNSSDAGSSGSGSRPSTNEEWLAALRDRDEEALQALRDTLIRGLRAALKKRVPGQADELAEDFAQEALLKILDELDSFRGESKLTTWAQKIAVRTAFTELRRKRWENVSFDEMLSNEDGPPQPGVAKSKASAADPEETVSQQALLDRVQAIIQEELTKRQRRAIQAVMQDMPLGEVAQRMDTNRNALYKVIHDARQKIKTTLEQQGLSAAQILAELGGDAAG